MPYANDCTTALRDGEWIFSLALDARVAVARMWLYVTAGDVGCEAFDHFRHTAWLNAARVGYHFADEPMPELLVGDCELEDGWAYGRGKRERERERELAAHELACAVDAALTDQLIEARDWAALNMPFLQNVNASLGSGKSVEVAGYFVIFREGLIWITNPYGHDSTLGDELSVDVIADFLVNLARGREYGPTPW